MKIYNLGKFKILTPKNMFVTFTEDNKSIVVISKKENEIHCIVELKDEKLLVSNGWNIKYSFYENELELQYNFNENE